MSGPHAARGLALAGVICIAGCGPAAPRLVNGWDVYGDQSHVTCGVRPVYLGGSHTALTVDGPCRSVRVAGDHNDISVTLAAGGEIEITGAHNDVTWHTLAGVPGRPYLLDHGASNTFHAPE